MLPSFTFSRGEDNNNNYDNDPIGLIVRLKYPKALANEASSTKLRNPRRLFRARENIKRASQSELKLKTREMSKARENASGKTRLVQVLNLIGWEGGTIFSGPIAQRCEAKPKKFWITWDTLKKKLLVMTNYWCHKKRKFHFIAYYLPFHFLLQGAVKEWNFFSRQKVFTAVWWNYFLVSKIKLDRQSCSFQEKTTTNSIQ